jgi:hypothetical protein
MHTEAALALANHLATTMPADGQSYDDYMADAFARWPDLSDAEIDWAIERAADVSRREAAQLNEEADELRQYKSRR